MAEQKPQEAFFKLLIWVIGFFVSGALMSNAGMSGQFHLGDALIVLASIVAIPATAFMSLKSLSSFVLALINSSKQKGIEQQNKRNTLAKIVEEAETLKRKNNG